MKPRWLLLSVSVICLLVLFPAAALSQVPRVNAGCGTATIDGYAWPAEWANAGKVDLFAELNAKEGLEIPIPLPDAGVPQADVSGELWVMNNESRVFTALNLRLDNATLHPDWWTGQGFILYTDRDGLWNAPDCGPPGPGEGWVSFYKDRIAGVVDDWFMGESQAGSCSPEPLVGIRWAVEPDRSLVFEHSFDLNSPQIGELEPGDCFRVGVWVFAWGCEQGTGCTETSGDWVIGMAQWPEGFDYTPASFGEVCLDPCEAEFVPEVGTIALLGSGLAGLAGYAVLRWRTRE